jgi:signal transduction histidine kinase
LALPGREPPLPHRVGLALFRICQQALANVVQHAAATTVEVGLRVETGMLRLEIADNGCGFVVPERWVDLARTRHFGLAGSAERAEAIGAVYSVTSAPGQGARVCVTLALQTFVDDATPDHAPLSPQAGD